MKIDTNKMLYGFSIIGKGFGNDVEEEEKLVFANLEEEEKQEGNFIEEYEEEEDMEAEKLELEKQRVFEDQMDINNN